MKCSIVVCPAPATWEGTIKAEGRDYLYREVAYCDEHAWTQVHSVPDGLGMSLAPIGQKEKQP